MKSRRKTSGWNFWRAPACPNHSFDNSNISPAQEACATHTRTSGIVVLSMTCPGILHNLSLGVLSVYEAQVNYNTDWLCLAALTLWPVARLSDDHPPDIPLSTDYDPVNIPGPSIGDDNARRHYHPGNKIRSIHWGLSHGRSSQWEALCHPDHGEQTGQARWRGRGVDRGLE